MDRPGRPAAHDRVQRRRRERVVRRRRNVDAPGQPADGADLPRLDRQRLPLPPPRWPAGQLDGAHPFAVAQGRSASATGSSTAGGESGHIVAKPDDPDIVFGGSYDGFLTRFDHRTGERRVVNVWPDNPMGWGAAELTYRFQWNFPIFFSPHDPNVLYAAAQRAVPQRPTWAHSWGQISPDLTRNDKSKHGPVRRADHQGQHGRRVLLHDLRRRRVQPRERRHLDRLRRRPGPRLARRRQDVDRRHAEGLAGVDAGQQHRAPPDRARRPLRRRPRGTTRRLRPLPLQDHRLRQDVDEDRQRASPPTTSPASIRADPERPGLLYAGTERGVYVWFDDGDIWQVLQQNLPIVPITDLAVKEGDLMAATQGRGYWILDDITPLHQWQSSLEQRPVHLFTPRDTLRIASRRNANAAKRQQGTNPRGGAVFRYWLSAAPADDVAFSLTIHGPDGEKIDTWRRKKPKGKDDGAEPSTRRGPRRDVLPTKAGLNQWAWNLRHPAPSSFAKMVLWAGGLTGPRAIPGTYRATLTVGDATQTVTFDVKPNPLTPASQAAMVQQLTFCRGIGDTITRVHHAIEDIRTLRPTLSVLRKRAKKTDSKALLEAIKQYEDAAKSIEEALYQTKNRSRQDPLNFPIRLNDKLATLMRVAMVGDEAPTAQMRAVGDALTTAADEELAKLQALWTDALPRISAMAVEAGLTNVERPKR